MIVPALPAVLLLVLHFKGCFSDPGYAGSPADGNVNPPSLDQQKTPSLKAYSSPELEPYDREENSESSANAAAAVDRIYSQPDTTVAPPASVKAYPDVYLPQPSATNEPANVVQQQQMLPAAMSPADPSLSSPKIEATAVKIEKTVLNDRDAINKEIDKIDAAIADIDSAIKSGSSQQQLKVDINVTPAAAATAAATAASEMTPAVKQEENVEQKPTVDDKTKAESEPATGKSAAVAAVAAEAADVGKLGPEETKQLLEKFRHSETLYHLHPQQPIDTRRLFDGNPSIIEIKVASLSRFRSFIKAKKMGGSVVDNERVCTKDGIKCNPAQKYRTFDGTCNNLKHPALGSIEMPFQRLLAPAYSDGFFLPRGTSDYSEETGYVNSLPSARVISDAVFDQGNESLTESPVSTHMMMQWGQFINHDITSTSKMAFDCCNPEIKNLPRCFSVAVTESDSFYSQFGKTCLDFTRSDHHCRSGIEHAEQFNRVTSFLDASQIYGNSKEFAMKLRGGAKRKQGKLLENSQLNHFLPSKFDVNIHASKRDLPSDFVTGDSRCETQASLTAIHNLFMNEHNQIAEKLFKELRAKSSKSDLELDEIVYQETRKLIIAEIQHITYQHYLPQLIGENGIKEHKLNEPQCIYDPKENPTVINSFTAAAFRHGHSLVQSIFRGENQPWRLGKFYGDSRFARGDGGRAYINELIGLSKQPCQKADVCITKQMTQLLFVNNKTEPGGGHDIGSTNIQRGRDHGLPSYNEFRKLCGQPPLESLTGEPPAGIDPKAWSRIGKVYSNPDDVDLYVGGLAEVPAGGLVGKTFACIIGKQFKMSMAGDRFFYHHTDGPNIFPLKGAAKREIDRRTLAAVICEVTKTREMSHNVFLLESSKNLKVPCSEFTQMDIKSIAAEIVI